MIAKASIRWNNRRMRYLMTFVLICFLSQPVWGQSPAATLAPTGTLRAVFLGGNPVQGRVDEKTGEMSFFGGKKRGGITAM